MLQLSLKAISTFAVAFVFLLKVSFPCPNIKQQFCLSGLVLPTCQMAWQVITEPGFRHNMQVTTTLQFKCTCRERSIKSGWKRKENRKHNKRQRHSPVSSLDTREGFSGNELGKNKSSQSIYSGFQMMIFFIMALSQR